MEVYATQPNSEVLKCQQHVVPNLNLHHHHRHLHHSLPKIHISPNRNSSSPSSSAISPSVIAPATSITTTKTPEMKRSYEKTKEPKQQQHQQQDVSNKQCSGGVIRTNHNNINDINVNNNNNNNKATSLPIISPRHNNKSEGATAATIAPRVRSTKLASSTKTNVNNNSSININGNGNKVADSNKKASPSSTCSSSSNKIEEVKLDTEAKSCASKFPSPIQDVFLGGSCNPTTWRIDQAIPLLEKLGISYYNPQVPNWCPELISLEHEAKTHAKCLLFVIDNQTRCVVSLIEVACLAAQGRKVVLVLPNQERQPGQSILGEVISTSEFEELTSAHLLLKQLVQRHQIPVFHDLDEAIYCISNIIHDSDAFKNNSASNHDILMEENLKHAFDSLSEKNNASGEIKYSDIPRAYKTLTKKYDLTSLQVKSTIENLSHHLQYNNTTIQLPSNNHHHHHGAADDTGSNSSSGDDSPPHKKELHLSDSFLNRNGGGDTSIIMSSASASSLASSSSSSSHEFDLINFEQFTYLMTELIRSESRIKSNLTTTTTTSNNNKRVYFIQQIKDVLEKLEDELVASASCSTSALLNGSSPTHDVFLGGSCSNNATLDSAWKTEKAIPLLKKHSLSYCSSNYYCNFSKQFSLSSAIDSVSTIDNCRVLFLYLNDSSRAVELMTLASYYVGLNRHHVVFCIEDLPEDFQIGEEKLTKLAIRDYNRGRAYLSDIAKRQEISVFQNLDEALDKVIDLCSSTKL